MMACEGGAGGRCAGVTRCETEADRTAAVGGNAISGVPPRFGYAWARTGTESRARTDA